MTRGMHREELERELEYRLTLSGELKSENKDQYVKEKRVKPSLVRFVQGSYCNGERFDVGTFLESDARRK